MSNNLSLMHVQIGRCLPILFIVCLNCLITVTGCTYSNINEHFLGNRFTRWKGSVVCGWS
jgi:hypothetical protein